MKKNYLQIFQEGGQAPAPEAPAEGGGGPEQMLMAVVESQDPNLALEFCNKMAQEMGIAPGGGAAPAPEAAPPMGSYGMKVPKVTLG